jgi:chitinase
MIHSKAVRRLAVLTFFLALASSADSAPPPDAATGKVFVGYLFGSPNNIDFRLYTHLCHAFITADADGTVRKGRNVPDKELTAKAHDAGVKVLVSLGGWGWDKQFAAIVANPEAEDRYAKAVLEIVDSNDYDGIDLDWEYPDTAPEVVGFERLSRRFRKEIDAIGAKKNRPMFLTMAASANPGTLKWLDKDFLLATMDWINVMTYDYTGAWTDFAGHHSPLFASSKAPVGQRRSVEATMKDLLDERGFPPDRLALGIPLYGRGFAVAKPYDSTKGAPKTRIPQGDFRNLHTLEHEQGWTRQWDDETKNPWLLTPAGPIVIGYDDDESVAIKTEWAMKKGLRGVFFWQIHADRLPDGRHPLQEASHEKWISISKPN